LLSDMQGAPLKLLGLSETARAPPDQFHQHARTSFAQRGLVEPSALAPAQHALGSGMEAVP
jgi:hypothetical protein